MRTTFQKKKGCLGSIVVNNKSDSMKSKNILVHLTENSIMERVTPDVTGAGKKQRLAKTFYKYIGGQWISAKSEIF